MTGTWSYLAAAGLAVLAAAALTPLVSMDLRVPLTYGGDALFAQAIIKGILDHGWYLDNESLGMPMGMTLRDFPLSDTLSFGVLKLLGLAFPDSGLLVNLFFLLSLPVTAVAALWAFMRLKISTAPALCCSLLYAFSNYHITRGVSHLLYSAYFAIPLVIVLALSMTAESVRRVSLLAGLLICGAAASTGNAYHTSFALCLLVTAAVIRCVEQRSLGAAARPLAFATFTLLVMIANVMPTILYRAEHGSVEIAVRKAFEAENYAIKPAQLVLPIVGHRLPPLADLRARYDTGPLVNENSDCTLGFVGATGFVMLLAWLLFGRLWRGGTEPTRRLWDHMSILNAVCLMVGVVGGIGALIALLLSPQIRAYNRISTCLLFLSLCATGLALEKLVARCRGSRKATWAARSFLVALTALGLLDQIPAGRWDSLAATEEDYAHDAEFFARVQAAVPSGSMIFQFPAAAFPEGASYDHLRAYVHTRGLRWSYGAIEGRMAQKWQDCVMKVPGDQLVETLVAAGFVGVIVDRCQVADGGAAIEATLTQAGAPAPMSSRLTRWSYFDLSPCAQRYRASLSEQEWATRRHRALNFLRLDWVEGFYPPPETQIPGHLYRWCAPRARFTLEAISEAPQTTQFEVLLAALTPGTVRVRTRWTESDVLLPGEGSRVPYACTLVVPPGVHDIVLEWQGPLPSSGYPPFVVDNPKLSEPFPAIR